MGVSSSSSLTVLFSVRPSCVLHYQLVLQHGILRLKMTSNKQCGWHAGFMTSEQELLSTVHTTFNNIDSSLCRFSFPVTHLVWQKWLWRHMEYICYSLFPFSIPQKLLGHNMVWIKIKKQNRFPKMNQPSV